MEGPRASRGGRLLFSHVAAVPLPIVISHKWENGVGASILGCFYFYRTPNNLCVKPQTLSAEFLVVFEHTLQQGRTQILITFTIAYFMSGVYLYLQE